MSNPMKPLQVVVRISQSLCIVLLLLTCGVLSAQNQEHRVRNIVLVHGAWADGSGWKDVCEILVKDGYNVSVVQEPETSFKDDVAATKRVLALQDGPSILVAHSYGGSVIRKQARVHQLSDWFTWQRTCQTAGKMKETTGSASRATSPNRAP